MKYYENANGMQCMILQHKKHNTQPKNFTRSSKVFKNAKPRSKCMKNEGLREHTRGETHNLGQNPIKWEVLSEKREFGG